MNDDTERFSHEKSSYERPRQPYRCGRRAAWSQACWQGPDARGNCGGVAECTPVRSGDHWACRRPQRAGGPCHSGPLPDGQCAHRHPPCTPRASLRIWRARIAWLAAGSVIALIALFTTLNGSGSANMAALDAGTLHSAHGNFTSGCETCHEGHGGNTLDWLASAFVRKDISEKCLDCHSFDGPERAAHNTDFDAEHAGHNMNCTACHTEHQGADSNIARLSNAQCGTTCHDKDMLGIDRGHPEFSSHFPSTDPGNIRFDHVSHIEDYFLNPKYSKRAPDFARRASDDCTTCHMVETASREVTPGDYGHICATCHEDQIRQRDLVVFELPEMTAPFPAEQINDVCGTPLAEAAVPADEFESISYSDPSPLSALYMPAAEDQEAEEGSADTAMHMLINELAAQGVGGLIEALQTHGAEQDAPRMLSGLATELVQRQACAWMNNEEYIPDEDAGLAGWYAGDDGLTLRYRPTGHADPVIKSWISFALSLSLSADDAARMEAAGGALESLLDDRDGAGACAKCHIIAPPSMQRDGTVKQVGWGMQSNGGKRHTPYSHAPHIDLLGPEKSCTSCHLLDPKADHEAYFKTLNPEDYLSNFKPIERQTCAGCHTQSKALDDCQLCHVYHRKTGFKKRMVIK